ncbi:hypothetical protein FKB36_09470 [Methanoculleus sp. Afa-1]|uniref:Uncharacterized protein n=1 Tax=Methanoculleus formosensis TaxID=2590886 RepID=A0A9E4ZM78_9EURY|nr:hypothetical protein [Methanoculleus sp. Afa-1]MCT8337704.1 hypothetical protein [Methanoculleus sp. Afa-1]
MNEKTRTRNTQQTLRILIALCICGAMFVPIASAYDRNGYAELDASNLPKEGYSEKLIASLIGKDITYAEFYEAIYPGEMEKLPENLQELYRSSKIQWTASEEQTPEPLTEEEMSEIKSRTYTSTVSLIKVPSAEEGVTVLRSLVNNNAASDPIHVSITGKSWAYHGNRIVEYYSSTHSSPEIRMPYMSVKTRLFMFVEPAWVEIAYKEKTAVLPLSLTVMGEKSVDGGYFYQVLGDHYEIPPPDYVIIGSNPAYSTSQVFYVS